METSDYNKMEELRKKVDEYDTEKKSSTTISNTISTIFKLPNSSSAIFYIIPPILIAILLLLIKPKFITIDNIDKNNNITKKIVFTKILTGTLLMGFIIDIFLWAYLNK